MIGLPELPLSMREDLRPRTRRCANCGDPLELLARTLPEALLDIFPLDRDSLWCGLDCLEEWIGDRAARIARDGAVREVDA